jgi:cellulose synthase/poly-beta-1,6-N-acetylglucosamine synthase-like glycosyltransferase
MMLWLAIPICVWAVVQPILQLLLVRINWKDHHGRFSGQWPKVSILIAVRNEERELPALLKSLEKLDYPSDQLEILFAEDRSSDLTPNILDEWEANFPNRKVLRIRPEDEQVYHENGKANALAFLGKMASGDFLFFTDGDCQVPPTWIKEGVACFSGKVGILIGITKVRDQSFFGQLQALDWWGTLGIVKVVTDLNLPTTGLGNNMVISKAAYLASGGFEKLPPSLTEDLEISRAVVKAGFSVRQQVSERVLVHTKAEYSWKNLLKQRKRWVGGALTLSWGWKTLLALQVFFFPAVLILIYNDFKIGILFWLLKAFFQGLFVRIIAKKANQGISLFYLLIFDFYQLVTYTLTILYYFWPSSIEWKARKYP